MTIKDAQFTVKLGDLYIRVTTEGEGFVITTNAKSVESVREDGELKVVLSGVVPGATDLTEEWRQVLDRTVETLECSVRLANSLQNSNLWYIGEIVRFTEFELFSRNRHFGKRPMKELKELLADQGLTLGMKIDGWTRPQQQEKP